jgi:hypothetical protein
MELAAAPGAPPRSAELRHRVAPEHRVYHDCPATLQATAPPSRAVDAGAALSGPLLDRLLGIVTGRVPLGKHPPDDGADAIRGLPVERPAAHVPVYTEISGGFIGELPILVVRDTC